MIDTCMAIWTFIEDFLKSNDLASGGIVVVIVGGILAYLRTVPAYIYQWVHYRLVTTVEIRDSDSSFDWVRYWLSHHEYSSRSRLLEVASYNVLVDKETGEPVTQVGVEQDHYDEDSIFYPLQLIKSNVVKRWIFRFIPGDGWHWFFYRGRLLYVTKVTTENQSSKKRMETFHLSFLSRKRALVESLVEEARALYLGDSEREEKITIWNAGQSGAYWSDSIQKVARPLDSLIFDTDITKMVVEDIREFLSKREWYHKMGIPWHRGYLLTGPPGNGKTSLILGVAGEFKRDICMVSLSAGIDEVDFLEKINNMPTNSILVLEDVDCLNLQVNRSGQSLEKSPISLSCLMNVLDGLYSQDGMIVFMTTNKLEALDPTMVRGGRADLKIEIKNATPMQALTMFRKFFGPGYFSLEHDIGELVSGLDVSMATIQGAILECLKKPEDLPEVLARDIAYMAELTQAQESQGEAQECLTLRA